MNHVRDIDQGWRKVKSAVATADGLELMTGYVTGSAKYPKKRGKTEVAKVAAVHRIFRAISEAYDAERRNTDRAFDRIHGELLAGRTDTPKRIYDLMGKPLRDAMREAAMDIVIRRTGRLEAGIRASVFDRKMFEHGDDPKGPKTGETF